MERRPINGSHGDTEGTENARRPLVFYEPLVDIEPKDVFGDDSWTISTTGFLMGFEASGGFRGRILWHGFGVRDEKLHD